MDDPERAYEVLGPDTRTGGLLERGRIEIPALGALALSLIPCACLFWLLYRGVLSYLQIFELTQARLTPLSRAIIVSSHWLIRLLPFLTVTFVLGLVLIQHLRLTRVAWRAAMVTILVSGPLALVASCVVIYGMNRSLMTELAALRERAGGEPARLDLELAGTRLNYACHDGSAFACTVVGQMILEGHVGKSDPKRAQVFLKKACDGGSELGCQYLARARRESEALAPAPTQGAGATPAASGKK